VSASRERGARADISLAPAQQTFALVGNPNSGKTTLFNALTGLRQKVGNYPGVTVERKEGITYSQHGKPLRLIDLPGTYSLRPESPDEQIAADVVLGRRDDLPTIDVIICVLDASQLDRHLYLLTQVLEVGKPVIVALNMVDMAERRGLKVAAKRLHDALGVPVISLRADTGEGTLALRLAMSRSDLAAARPVVAMPTPVGEAVRDLQAVLSEHATHAVNPLEAQLALVEGAPDALPSPAQAATEAWQAKLNRTLPGWRSGVIEGRYHQIHQLVASVVTQFDPDRRNGSERLDDIFLHPVGGLAFFAAIMSGLFYAIFWLAAPLMDLVDGAMAWLGDSVWTLMPPGEVRELVVNGAIAGVGGVVIFLPQILMLFFFIGLLESTGYMARAAFLLDRIMRQVGLNGKSFVPLLSSYACAIPGVMATRTIASPKDRLITILVAPFMSCSARLPVYVVMIAALVPPERYSTAMQAGLMLMLYLLGTVGAFAFAWLFKKTLLKGTPPAGATVLPAYQWPKWRNVALELRDRGWIFLRRAGTIIFALSVLIWFAMNYPKGPEPVATDAPATAMVEAAPSQLEYSFAGRLGKAVEPVFAPLGYDWKLSVGVLASFAAREVFVSTMAIAYGMDEDAKTDSLVETFRAQTRPDGTPVFTPRTCLSILVFFVFALQCVSTIAVVRRETNSWRWPLFQLGFMLATAWFAAMLVYQVGGLF